MTDQDQEIVTTDLGFKIRKSDLVKNIRTPNWKKWAGFDKIELWKAVALCFNHEPDDFGSYRGMAIFNKFLEQEEPIELGYSWVCPAEAKNLIAIADSHLGNGFKYYESHPASPERSIVSLPDFVAWAETVIKLPDIPVDLRKAAAARIEERASDLTKKINTLQKMFYAMAVKSYGYSDEKKKRGTVSAIAAHVLEVLKTDLETGTIRAHLKEAEKLYKEQGSLDA